VGWERGAVAVTLEASGDSLKDGRHSEVAIGMMNSKNIPPF
jgi:hypothetical protein